MEYQFLFEKINLDALLDEKLLAIHNWIGL